MRIVSALFYSVIVFSLLALRMAAADSAPAWAYPLNNPDYKPPVDDGNPVRVPIDGGPHAAAADTPESAQQCLQVHQSWRGQACGTQGEQWQSVFCRVMVAISASQSRAADAVSVSRMLCRSKVDRLITLSTSAVAVCC
jgi:hypothetical protein